MYAVTDNPLKDFSSYDREQHEVLSKRPVCCCCHEPIQQDDAFCVNGEYWCDDCMNDMRVSLMGEIWGDNYRI